MLINVGRFWPPTIKSLATAMTLTVGSSYITELSLHKSDDTRISHATILTRIVKRVEKALYMVELYGGMYFYCGIKQSSCSYKDFNFVRVT